MDKDALLEVLAGRTLSQRLAIREQFETLYSFDPLTCFESGALAFAGPSPLQTPRRKGSSTAAFSLYPLLPALGLGLGEGIEQLGSGHSGICAPEASSGGVGDPNGIGFPIAAHLLQQPTVRTIELPTVSVSPNAFETPRRNSTSGASVEQPSANRARVGANLRRLCRALLQTPDELDAEALHDVISGRAQSDEQCIEEILCTRSSDELARVKQTFFQSECWSYNDCSEICYENFYFL